MAKGRGKQQPMLGIQTTGIARAIVLAALGLHAKKAHDAKSALGFLRASTRTPDDHLGTNEYLANTFRKAGEMDDALIEIHASAAQVLVTVITIWAVRAQARHEADNLTFEIDSDYELKRRHVQNVLTQVQDQLSLPLLDIASLAAAMSAPKRDPDDPGPVLEDGVAPEEEEEEAPDLPFGERMDGVPSAEGAVQTDEAWELAEAELASQVPRGRKGRKAAPEGE